MLVEATKGTWILGLGSGELIPPDKPPTRYPRARLIVEFRAQHSLSDQLRRREKCLRRFPAERDSVLARQWLRKPHTRPVGPRRPGQ